MLGYQRIAKSCGLSVNLPVFAVPNIVKSSLAYLPFLTMMLSAKTDARLTCLICRIMGRFLPQPPA
jgi:hypothetical protein